MLPCPGRTCLISGVEIDDVLFGVSIEESFVFVGIRNFTWWRQSNHPSAVHAFGFEDNCRAQAIDAVTDNVRFTIAIRDKQVVDFRSVQINQSQVAFSALLFKNDLKSSSLLGPCIRCR